MSWKWSLIKFGVFTGIFLAVVWIIHMCCPPFLITYSLSLLVITLGVILDAKESKMRKMLKYSLYILFFLYSMYLLGLFSNLSLLSQLNPLETSTFLMAMGSVIIFGVVAPLCMLIIGKQLTNIKIRGRKVFTYGLFWLIYLVLLVIWELFLPEQVIIEFLLVFFIISLFLVYYFNNKREDW